MVIVIFINNGENRIIMVNIMKMVNIIPFGGIIINDMVNSIIIVVIHDQ